MHRRRERFIQKKKKAGTGSVAEKSIGIWCQRQSKQCTRMMGLTKNDGKEEWVRAKKKSKDIGVMWIVCESVVCITSKEKSVMHEKKHG